MGILSAGIEKLNQELQSLVGTVFVVASGRSFSQIFFLFILFIIICSQVIQNNDDLLQQVTGIDDLEGKLRINANCNVSLELF